MTDSGPGATAAPRALLVAGLLAGIAAAAVGLAAGKRPGAPPAQAVAEVNGRPILRDAWLRAVAAVGSERRTPLSAADRQSILDRLIDEELLVQHGLALGLAERNPRLRSALVSEVMLAATLAAESAEADEDALRRFYAVNRAFFTPAAQLRVAAWRLDRDGRRQTFQPAVPDAPLPPATLRHYLGSELTALALTLEPGAESAPVDGGGGRVVLALRERRAGQAPPFEQVREQVKAEFRRRADEDAVRALLDELRRGARIAVQAELP